MLAPPGVEWVVDRCRKWQTHELPRRQKLLENKFPHVGCLCVHLKQDRCSFHHIKEGEDLKKGLIVWTIMFI